MQRILRDIAIDERVRSNHRPLNERVIRPDLVAEEVRGTLVVLRRRE